MEYFPNGTYFYTEDGFSEHGTFKAFEDDRGLLEEVTQSDVKERVGRKTRSKIEFLTDQLTLLTEPDDKGMRTKLVYLRLGAK